MNPYRDQPPRAAPSFCEVCGGDAKEERCIRCAAARVAIEKLLPTLELPIVLVAVRGTVRGLAGAGLVLIDRWREIAQCASRLPEQASFRAIEAIARGRAGLWAPGAHVAMGWDETEHVLAEVLVRTPASLDGKICVGFRRAWEHAERCAEIGRDRHGTPGSKVVEGEQATER